MAYSGFLLKIGSYEFPLKYISWESYDVTKQIIDLDSHRNANGVLHRNALSHYSIKIKFDTVGGLSSTTVSKIISGIKENYLISKERKCSVTAYVPEEDSYITQDMYIADITFPIRKVTSNTILYKPLSFTFIGY